MSTAIKIPSVNFHLWRPCNMKCGFCFATFQDIDPDNLPKGHIGRDDCISVVEALGEAGFQKINFAGGEPTLCPWLSELITRASDIGLVTSIVTNGSRITPDWLQSVEGHLDWTALSIATVLSELDLKGLLSGSERELRLPGCSVSHHRVEYRQQLPHTRHQRDFTRLASRRQPLVELPYHWIVPPCARRRHVQRSSHSGAPSPDAAPASVRSTVPVHRRNAH